MLIKRYKPQTWTSVSVAVIALVLCSCMQTAKVHAELELKEHYEGQKLAGQNEDTKVQGNIQEIDKDNLQGAAMEADAKLPKPQMPVAIPVKTAVNLGFVHAFVASLSVIIVSELGDKTFFIAAIMAMRHSRITVFVGALGALIVMTILSTLLGYATTIIPRWFTYYASTFLFALFGLRMLREGWNMSADEGQEELEEVQADLKRRDEEIQENGSIVSNGIDCGDKMEKATAATVTQDLESGIIRGGKQRKIWGIFSPIFLQAFVLTFLAEWGDRSQITTIILAAREDVLGVSFGGFLGHGLCTALAVVGGRMIAQRISAKTVTLVGGVVFLVFALSALFISPD